MKVWKLTPTVVLTICTVLVGCGSKDVGRAPESGIPKHTVVYGGDLSLARQLNRSLYSAKEREQIFAGVQPLLKDADIALVNGEGVVSSGGRFTDKGEPRPYMYRAHPLVMGPMVEAGIDVVTVGNNHAGDYGEEAFIEMLDLFSKANIGYTGGGYNLEDALKPYYKRLGDTVVAIIGGDATLVEPVRATKDRAGPLFLDYFFKSKSKDNNKVINHLKPLLKEARKHAHVVFFTPHWGANFRDAPNKAIRSMAKKIIDLGFDGILGHSAHWFHGIEIIKGKPVIYDAGNLVVDYGGGDQAHHAFLWELTFTKAGVTEIAGHPLWLEMNRAVFAEGVHKEKLLEELLKRSKKLGADLRVEDGVAKMSLNPGRIYGPEKTVDPPTRPTVQTVRKAPSDSHVDELPEDAVKADIRYENGVRIVGYRLFPKELAVPKGAQFVQIFFTTDKKIEESYDVHLEARGEPNERGSRQREYANHIPGDWLVPTDRWEVGKIISDWTLIRLRTKPKGNVDFYVGLRDRRSILEPVSSDKPIIEGKLIHIGQATYRKGAPWIFQSPEAAKLYK